jgi:hypothetical protein
VVWPRPPSIWCMTRSFSDQGCCTFPSTLIIRRRSIRSCLGRFHEYQKYSPLLPLPSYHLLMIRVNYLKPLW